MALPVPRKDIGGIVRDLRDPQQIGLRLQELRRLHPKTKIWKLADRLDKQDQIQSNGHVQAQCNVYGR
jgi:hypothetical protein